MSFKISCIPVFLYLISSSFAYSVSADRVYAAASSEQEIVITSFDLATEAGKKTLRKGGNAFDAFVAATFVHYVVAGGATSAAGPLQAVLYDAKSREVVFLKGDFTHSQQEVKATRSCAFGVSGAVRALEALSKRYGRLSFAECVRPAYELARDGFKVTPVYARSIERKSTLLRHSSYGLKTFFKKGVPLQAGDSLYLVEVAEFLSHLREDGANYMYQGEWAKKEVALIQNLGGQFALEDFAACQAVWNEPQHVSYRGFDIYGPASLEKTDQLKNAIHSMQLYPVLAADREGNMITGTNTSLAEPWASGYFIEGIVLNQGGSFPPLLMHLVLEKKQPRFATGAFDSSLPSTQLQSLMNLIDQSSSQSNSMKLPETGVGAVILIESDGKKLGAYSSGSPRFPLAQK